MKSHAEASREKMNLSEAGGVYQRQRGYDLTPVFADKRLQATAQRTLQEAANNSPQVMRLRSFQDISDHNPRDAVVQRRIAAWSAAVCRSGTVVYHNTGQDSAISLVTDGVQQVQNAWGGGILGAGFYTHTTPGGADVYGNARFTLSFRVNANLQGQVVPRGVIGRGIDAQDYGNENYLTGNDFLTNEDDRNEYKFHSGNNLVFVSVRDNQTGITYNDAQAFINAILG